MAVCCTQTCMAIVLNTEISYGSVATHLGCYGIVNNDFITNLLSIVKLSVPVKSEMSSENR